MITIFIPPNEIIRLGYHGSQLFDMSGRLKDQVIFIQYNQVIFPILIHPAISLYERYCLTLYRKYKNIIMKAQFVLGLMLLYICSMIVTMIFGAIFGHHGFIFCGMFFNSLIEEYENMYR